MMQQNGNLLYGYFWSPLVHSKLLNQIKHEHQLRDLKIELV